jgi:4-amino-4-deoxy-L-arabinose transferase-like glycosyltransferase
MTHTGPARGVAFLRRAAPAAALALAVGLVVVGPRRFTPVTFVLLVGIVATLVTAGAGFSLPRGPEDPPEEPLAGRRTLLLAVVGSVLGTALLVASLRRFAASESVSQEGWALFLSALLAFAGGFFPWRGAPPVPRERVRFWEIGGLLVVLSVAAAFRLHELRTLPYGVWFDEAENTLVTKRILEQPGYRPIFVAEASKMPALAFYIFEPFVKMFPERALGVRVATTSVGLLALAATWLLGRELFGRETGLLASGFLAVSRWHVDFSRFGVANIFSTLAAPLVLFLLLRSQRRRSVRDAVLSGLALGLGIQLYYSMIALPAIMAVWFLRRLLSRERKHLAAAGLLALTLVAAAFAYAPLWQFARRNPEHFAERFRATAVLHVGSYGALARLLAKPSPERRHAIEVLGESLIRHAKMFHYMGDVNGRHNLPLAPMLEASTGVLFGVGFLLCLLTLRDHRALLLLLAFGAFFAAGVLSVDFEAPQAARTLGLVPFACVMAALPLAMSWEALGASRAAAVARWGLTAVAIGLVAWAGVDSWRAFFQVQPFDPGAFAAWSTQETKIADVVAAEGKDDAVFVPPPILGSPTIRLLLGGSFQGVSFLSGRDLPLEAGGRRAIVFIGRDDPEAANLIRHLYPNATFEAFEAPRAPGQPAGESILTIARVPAATIEELYGWTTTLVSRGREEASRSAESVWDWSKAAIPPPFTARVRGRLLVRRDGPYTLVLSGGERAFLRVDGGTLLAPGWPRAVVADLARGTHDVTLDFVVSRPSVTALKWGFAGAEPVPIPSSAMVSPRYDFGGLLGSYYRGLGTSGTPVFRRIDPSVAFYFHEVPVDRPFSIRWTGTLLAPEDGDYAFSTKSIDISTVALDGKEIVRNPGALTHSEGILRLGKGPHAIEVTLQNRSDYAQIFLSWVRPGHEREIVPAEVLRPPPAASQPEGRALPRRKSS